MTTKYIMTEAYRKFLNRDLNYWRHELETCLDFECANVEEVNDIAVWIEQCVERIAQIESKLAA
jgi:hypothetical protein